MILRRKQTGISWIVVFLGNPGPKYDGTRHNAGFMTADAFERKNGVKIGKLRFQSKTASCRIGDEQVLLLKPLTYMNLSGSAVREAAAFYKVPTERILVVSDDISLPVGKLRVRRSGSAGGHNGLKDIIAKCGGDGFPRIKLGVGAPPNPEYEMIDWVLSAFRGKDAEEIQKAAERAAEAIEAVITSGVDSAMNKFNG